MDLKMWSPRYREQMEKWMKKMCEEGDQRVKSSSCDKQFWNGMDIPACIHYICENYKRIDLKSSHYKEKIVTTGIDRVLINTVVIIQ